MRSVMGWMAGFEKCYDGRVQERQWFLNIAILVESDEQPRLSK